MEQLKFSDEKYIGLGQVAIGIGAVLDGRNILENEFRDPNIFRRVVEFRGMTEKCLLDCLYCFTDKPKKTLTLNQIKDIIDQLSDLKVRAINYLGEGEPTLDKNFFEIIEYTAKKGIQPVIFTDAATKLRDINFVRKIKSIGASICPKCDSLRNEEYQNQIVKAKKGDYFQKRNEAIQLLIDEGFNQVQPDGSTHLGFDMIISKKNMHEIEKTLRYCRENNIRIVFSFFIPAGRCLNENFDKNLMLSQTDKKEIYNLVQKIDKEYNFHHPVWNNFITTPCVEVMHIFGDGKVSTCAGNETIIGNTNIEPIFNIRKNLKERYPIHNCESFDGNCPYRDPILEQLF